MLKEPAGVFVRISKSWGLHEDTNFIGEPPDRPLFSAQSLVVDFVHVLIDTSGHEQHEALLLQEGRYRAREEGQVGRRGAAEGGSRGRRRRGCGHKRQPGKTSLSFGDSCRLALF